MVVDIYGSKEIFVNEYRSLLADRLLSQLDFNPGREIRNLELLKLRFDETMLHTCQVMLKDITDSKRINSHIQTTIETLENGNCFLLSKRNFNHSKTNLLHLRMQLKCSHCHR